ncbi:TIGR04222 domain-containing membrane protein [Streptomyces sp. NPDC003860]
MNDRPILALVLSAIVGGLSVALIAAALSLRAPRAPRGGARAVHDAYDAAFLSGGPARVVDTAVAGLNEDGKLDITAPARVSGHGVVAVRGTRGRGAVQQGVLDVARQHDHGELRAVRNAAVTTPVIQEIGDRLADQGLMFRPSRQRRAVGRWARIQWVACLLGLVVALAVTFVTLPDESVLLAFLPQLLVGALVAGVVHRRVRRRVTGPGRAALRMYRKAHSATRATTVRVALLGPRMVPDADVRVLMAAAAAAPLAVVTAGPVSSSSDSVTPSAGASWCGGDAGGWGGGSGCGMSGGCGGGGGGDGGGGGGGGGGCGGGGGGCGGGGGG